MKESTAGRGRRILCYLLGTLWLVDGLLQIQPGMFTRAFYGKLPDSLMPSTLQTVHDAAAPWIAPTLGLTQWLYSHLPIFTNSMVIAIQLALAAVLFFGRSTAWLRVGAIGSITWGLIIWVFGEGMSGLFSLGGMDFYAGFPGSALGYSFAGYLLLLSRSQWESGQVYRIATRALSILFLLCALLQVLPQDGEWAKESQMALFGNSGFQSQPAFLAAPVMAFTTWISNDHAIFVNLLEIILLVYAAGVTWWWSKWSFVFRAFVYIWLLASWWFGMDFGFLFSGLSTDPNTPPIVAAILFSQSPRFFREVIPAHGYEHSS